MTTVRLPEGWERIERGWYHRPGHGSILRESDGWWWYPDGDSGQRHGPHRSLVGALWAAEESTRV